MTWMPDLSLRLPSSSCFLPYRSDDLMPLPPRAAESGLVRLSDSRAFRIRRPITRSRLPRSESRPMPKADIVKLFLKTYNSRQSNCRCRCNRVCWSLLKVEVEDDGIAFS